MRRMKNKVNRALRDTQIQVWPEESLKRKWKCTGKIKCMSSQRWASKISSFDPRSCNQDGEIEYARIKRGISIIRWEDDLKGFANFHGFDDWRDFGQHYYASWQNFTEDFVNYILNDE